MTTDDHDMGAFKLDPEARSFRLTGYRWCDLPVFLIVLVLAVCLATGFNLVVFFGLSFLSADMQRVASGLLLGLCLGYLLGVRIGGQRTKTGAPQRTPAGDLPLPPLSDRVKRMALEPDGFIAAIKACREETGAGLREAKSAVEAYLQEERS
ncbi:MAG: hypothetical protein ACPGVU_13390 [Limisphaerales bacterium]